MNDRFDILEELIKKETVKIIDGAAIWEEIENACTKNNEEGTQWVTGQDDPVGKWEYYVDIKHEYEEKYDQWFTDVRLLEVKIEDRQLHKTWYVKYKGQLYKRK